MERMTLKVLECRRAFVGEGVSALVVGLSISLKPPIDDWTVKCGSHYQIRRNRVRWLVRWSLAEAETGGFLA